MSCTTSAKEEFHDAQIERLAKELSTNRHLSGRSLLGKIGWALGRCSKGALK